MKVISNTKVNSSTKNIIEKYPRLTDSKYVDLVKRAPIGYASEIHDFMNFIKDHQDSILSINLKYDVVRRTLEMQTHYYSCKYCNKKAVAKHVIMIFCNVEPEYHKLLDEIYCPLPTEQARLITSLIFEEIIAYVAEHVADMTISEQDDMFFDDDDYDDDDYDDEDDDDEAKKEALAETMRIWRGYTGVGEMGQL